MYRFPPNVYSDVRGETHDQVRIKYRRDKLQEEKVRRHQGYFIRVYDGQRWHCSCVTESGQVQEQLDFLAAGAQPNPRIDDDPVVHAMGSGKKEDLRFQQSSISLVPVTKKRELLASCLPLLQAPQIVHHEASYVDSRLEKTFHSSKGARLHFDRQVCGLRLDLDLVSGKQQNEDFISECTQHFDTLQESLAGLPAKIKRSIDFVQDAVPVKPGVYPVLLSPETAGIFTHESFGHKSEADFMVGDEAMRQEWTLGKKVGASLLTIIDDGTLSGQGYTPFDDEGNAGQKTCLIREGKLSGRLHSAATAAHLGEDPTGNARAVDFRYEPIVRMSTTYIEKGTRPVASIIAEMDDGIYIESVRHGSGMSTFTLAPIRAYRIENGKITTPVRISVVTGNVFETLSEVDALSREFEIRSFVGGGCGKMEQFPLPVGFGGPYTRVRKLSVQ